MSTLITYFLNAGLDSQMSSYGLSCLNKLEKSIRRKKTQILLPQTDLSQIKTEVVHDLIEIYFFNVRNQGLLISGSDSPVAKIVELDDDPTDSDAYNHNRKNLWSYFRLLIKEIIFDETDLITIRRPKDWKSLSLDDELILMYDLSQCLIDKYDIRILKGSHDRWVLQVHNDSEDNNSKKNKEDNN